MDPVWRYLTQRDEEQNFEARWAVLFMKNTEYYFTLDYRALGNKERVEEETQKKQDLLFGDLLAILGKFGYHFVTAQPRPAKLQKSGVDLATFDITNMKLLRRGDFSSPEAIYIPSLRLASRSVRNITGGVKPYTLFLGCSLVCPGVEESTWTMVWGDYMLYRTGNPDMEHFIAIRGSHSFPPPERVKEVVACFLPRNG